MSGTESRRRISSRRFELRVQIGTLVLIIVVVIACLVGIGLILVHDAEEQDRAAREATYIPPR